MERLKRILANAFQDRSPRYLLGVLALGVAIALVAGMAIGYRVEQSRVKPAKKTATPGKTGTKKPPKVTLTAAPDLTGVVFSATSKQLIALYGTKKPARFTLGPKTRIAVAHAAKASAITVGSRVLFQPSASSPTTAVEVVVLPAHALIGVPVTKVVPGTSMTLKSLKGAGTVVRTTGAPVYQTGPGSFRSLVKKARVVVRYFRVGAVTKKRNAAVQVVVLPATSKFR